jgi:hypothetical protein
LELILISCVQLVLLLLLLQRSCLELGGGSLERSALSGRSEACDRRACLLLERGALLRLTDRLPHDLRERLPRRETLLISKFGLADAYAAGADTACRLIQIAGVLRRLLRKYVLELRDDACGFGAVVLSDIGLCARGDQARASVEIRLGHSLRVFDGLERFLLLPAEGRNGLNRNLKRSLSQRLRRLNSLLAAC